MLGPRDGFGCGRGHLLEISRSLFAEDISQLDRWGIRRKNGDKQTVPIRKDVPARLTEADWVSALFVRNL